MRRRIALALITVLLLAALGAGAWHWWKTDHSAAADLTFFGNVDVREATLAFNVGGRVESMRLDEGDAVQAGALMARLEPARFQDRLEAARAQVAQQAAVLARLKAGSRPEEIERARAEAQAAQAALRNARLELERQQELHRKKLTSQQAVDTAREARDRFAANLRAARQTLALAEQGPRQEDIAAARAQLNAAQAQLALARTDLNDTELHAPSDGTVLVRVVEPGTVVSAGAPVYTLSIRDPVWVRAYVPEPELGRIRPGMPVEVHTDSRPGRPYRGQIGFISPTAEFTPKTVQTPDVRTSLVYRFRVIIDNPDQGLRQGMPVTVRIPQQGQADANGG